LITWDKLPATEAVKRPPVICEGRHSVAEVSHAVFLSYASQDAEAAQKIAEALRAGDIEVFLDQSELRGGDAWDKKIRHEIRDCVLFIPIVSQHTQERLEGYFRHEWKLAVERAHHMAEQKAFLVPVVIDGTGDQEAFVPSEFREVQWTRLPAGETPPEFVTRIKKLLSGESAPVPTMARRPAAATPRKSSRLVPVILAVVLASVAAYLLVEKPWTAKLAPPAQSIAVLPLANESGDANEQYFSDGISEDLITALSQLPGLNVIGRTSSFRFRDTKEDSRSIGAKLGVAHLLEGSVRRSGDVVRVSAELINTANGIAQWSDRYDRPYKDLFALQDEITRAVAGALRTKLLPGEHAAAQSERPPSGNLAAYNAFLQGQFYVFRRTEVDTRRAIEFYTQATELDPRYALAWSWLSRTWLALGIGYLEGAPAQEAYAKARAASDRALSLSPELAAAHVSRGVLLAYADLDWRGSEAEFRRALELAPNDGETRVYLGRRLAAFGDVEQAIELTRKALATEPLRANWYNVLGVYLCGLNRLDEAEQSVRKAIELQPGAVGFHGRLVLIQIQRGNPRAALAAAEQEPPGFDRDIAFAFARQVGGDRSAADAALKRVIDKQAGGAAYQIAQVYALRNDAKETFAWLDRAWSSRDSGIGLLLYDPLILRYKDDPRFAAFCKKVGLPTPAEVGKRA
jgi:TolB-like protein/Flp pilus assembly protein TadD